MLQDLPLDLVWDVVSFLDVPDLLSLRTVSTDLKRALERRFLWLHALRLLARDGPYPHLRHALSSTNNKSDATALRHAATRLSRLGPGGAWHAQDARPRCVRYLTCEKGVKQAELVPGGEWLLVLLDGPKLRLRRAVAVEGNATFDGSERVMMEHQREVTVQTAFDRPELELKLFPSSRWTALVVMRMTQPRSGQDTLCVFGLDLAFAEGHHDQHQTFVPLARVETQNVTKYTAVDDLFLYGRVGPDKEDTVHFQTLPSSVQMDEPVRHGAVNLGSDLISQDFALTPLSRTRLLVSHTLGLSLYALPTELSTEPCPTPEPTPPVWKTFFRMQHALPHVSPVLWESEPNRADAEAAQQRPVAIMGMNTFHVFQLKDADSAPEHDGAEHENKDDANAKKPGFSYAPMQAQRLFFTPPSYASLGFRRALWDHGSVRDRMSGTQAVVVKTCTLPRVGGEAEEAKLGSVHVPVDLGESAIQSSLDEASGRFALVLSRGCGAQRVAIVDV